MVDFQLNLDSESVNAAHPTEPLAVEPDTPSSDVLALLKVQKTGSILVCRDGALIGIFTERDALALMAGGSDLSEPIEKAMTANPVTIQAEETVGAAIKKMAAGGYRRLPILDADGRPQGVVKVSGIVRYLVEHFPTTIYNLPPEPNMVMHEREGA